MKKCIMFVLSLACVLVMSACDSNTEVQKDEKIMYVEMAQLTEEEKSIASLLDTNMPYRMFDYNVDGYAKSVSIKIKELDYGEWFEVASSTFQLSDTEGRIALMFDKLSDGCTISFQSAGMSGSYSHEPEVSNEMQSVGFATSVLNNREEVEYGKEVPLAMQIFSYNGSISSYGVESYFNPELYMSDEYEHVYVVTVEFLSDALKGGS